MTSVKDAYNQISKQWCANRRKNVVNTCVAEFAALLPAGARVLDAGCGGGWPIDSFLCENGFSVTGIDISEKMLQNAKDLRLNSCRFLLCDFLDFESEAPFDAIIAFDSLWHIRFEKQPEIYKKAASLLKPGGYFLFTHGRTRGEITGSMFGAEFYYSALDEAGIKASLRENGFDILQFTADYKEKTTGERDLLAVARKKIV